MKMWSTPIRVLLIYLVVIAVLATINWSGQDVDLYLTLARNIGALFLSSWLTYELLNRVTGTRKTRWEHRVISVLILFLLFDSLTPGWIFLLLGSATEVGQRFLRFPTGPVLNPAALSVVLISLFTGSLPTWWATNFGYRIIELMSVAAVLTFVIAGYVAYKYRKLWLVGAGAMAAAVGSLLILNNSPIYMLVDGTLAFFLLVMAIEPKTSPIIKREQVLFGGAVGGLAILTLHLGWPEPFTMSLLLGNLIFNFYRNRSWLHKKLFFPPVVPHAPINESI